MLFKLLGLFIAVHDCALYYPAPDYVATSCAAISSLGLCFSLPLATLGRYASHYDSVRLGC